MSILLNISSYPILDFQLQTTCVIPIGNDQFMRRNFFTDTYYQSFVHWFVPYPQI